MPTGFVWHERMMWHDNGPCLGYAPSRGLYPPGLHFENAETKRRFKNLMDGYGITEMLNAIPFEPASEAQLLQVHTQRYLETVKALNADNGGDAGEFAYVGPGSYEIATLGPGAVAAAARAVLSGRTENAYALTRPPGHHAEPDRGRGFCIFSNIGVAIRMLQSEGLARRIAVVDWDVHHGNGTEAVFYDDPTVLTISLHQERLYPIDTGVSGDRGAGTGEGFNINLPLPAGCGGGAYLAAMERLVVPAVERFAPDIIFVASGFDASYYDPLGHMMLGSQHYRAMTERLVTLARALCGGRLVVVHEGGYSDTHVPFCGVGTLEGLMGERTSVLDPFEGLVALCTGEDLLAHQSEAIDRVSDDALLALSNGLAREGGA